MRDPGRPGRFFDDLPGDPICFRPGTGLPGTQRLQDKEWVRAAVEQNGEALKFASEAMRDDKELECFLYQVDPVRAGKTRIPEQSLKHRSGRPESPKNPERIPPESSGVKRRGILEGLFGDS